MLNVSWALASDAAESAMAMLEKRIVGVECGEGVK